MGRFTAKMTERAVQSTSCRAACRSVGSTANLAMERTTVAHITTRAVRTDPGRFSLARTRGSHPEASSGGSSTALLPGFGASGSGGGVCRNSPSTVSAATHPLIPGRHTQSFLSIEPPAARLASSLNALDPISWPFLWMYQPSDVLLLMQSPAVPLLRTRDRSRV